MILSIAYIESAFNRAAVGKLNPSTVDYGLMQINRANVTAMKLDKNRLLRDERYSIEAACKILEGNRQSFASKVSYWPGLYRSGTAIWKLKTRRNAIAYDRMIKVVIKKIGHRVDFAVASSR